MKKILLSLLFVLFLLPLAVMGQCGSGLSVIDADGNTYATLKVGSHCWMQSNLKTRVPGSSIYRTDMYPDTSANLDIYGRLYNWYAAMNIQPGETPVVSEHGFVQGVCPSGWHLPNDVEVAQLMTNTTPALHDTHYWMVPGTNTTAYTMRPGGYYNANKNRGEDLRGNSYMWTAQSLDPLSPSIVWSDCHCDHFVVDESAAGNGMSVRCVHRIYQGTVTTLEASNVKSNQADLNGVVIFAGHDENYTRGFIYGTDMEHPSGDTVQTGQSEEGNYSFTINDLTENTTYHFRAYVVNDFDTVYGEWKTFTTPFMEVQTLNQIDNITMHMAKAYGNLTNMGGYESLNTGFLYGTSADALTDTAQREEAITATGNYDCVLNGLLSDTKYYYCAYLTNGRQTVYGDTLDFTTAYMEVETAAATNVTSSSGTLNGTLTALKGYTICGGKFRYGQSEDALDVYTGGSTLDQEGIDFSADLTDLLPNTTYYFQAFAANGTDTVYGEVKNFKTAADAFTCGTSKVKDVDDNEYNTVKIGNQCWMKENLRTSTNPASKGNIYTPTTEQVPGYDVNTYGRLYDWDAVMQGASSSALAPSDVQGICPTGWHVPSDAEWDTLTKYVFSIEDYKCGDDCGDWSAQSNVSCIAKALSATTGWSNSSKACSPGCNSSGNNATGFSALPAGGHSSIGYYSFGNFANFWSATETSSNYAHYRYLNYESTKVSRYFNDESTGYSVRCLRDPEAPAAMSVTTDSANTITKNGATLYGNVTDMGGKSEVKTGFKYGTSESTLTSIVSDEVAMMAAGQFSYGITGLTANTQYYYKAFAANGTDTVYGEVKNFTTLTDVVTDTIAFLPNGGQGAMDTMFVTRGDTVLNANTYTHGGNWQFTGWNTEADGSGTQYADQDAITTSGNLTLYAQWHTWCTGTPNTSVNELGTSRIDSVKDNKGNWYKVVQIGNQCWLKENMRTTTVSDSYNPTDEPRYNVETYGLLYTWDTALVICPDGWHLPSVVEFDTLKNYLNKPEYQCNNGDGYIAKALSSSMDWTGSGAGCYAGASGDKSNFTGFSAVPTGGKFTNFSNFGEFTGFWTTIENTTNTTQAYARALMKDQSDVRDVNYYKTTHISVRCVRDEEEPPFTCGTSKVKDINDNEYNTVQIGNQCWMKENLRTTTISEGAIYTPSEIGYDVHTYGLLYNWEAVMQGASSSNANPSGVQGICPTGWHVPSDAEWTQLTDYVNTEANGYRCDGDGTIAKALSSTTGWNISSTTCAVGNNQSDNNATGFSAVPAGYYFGIGGYEGFGEDAYFWSATQNGSEDAYTRDLYYDGACVYRFNNSKDNEFSVRCLRDAEVPAAMSVTTDSANTVTKNGATLYGNVTSLGTYDQVNAGFKYGTSEDALTSIVAKDDAMTATGLFSYGITGLTANTQYYYEAFAANGTDTVYGAVKDFTTAADIVTDTIVFVPNGGQGAMDTMFVTRGDTVLNANTYTHGGNWQFTGWNTEADGSGTQYADKDAITTNGNLTLYAQWHTWCTGIPKTSVNEFGNNRIDSVKDIDNNKYNVVQIGNQCWLKENLRTLTNGADTGNIYIPTTTGYDVETYGLLYDWAAVMQGESSTNYPDSGNVVRGICPEGWHVPSSNEWDTLTTYVNSVTEYRCGGTDKAIAKSLAATMGWNPNNNACRIGNLLSHNNATGFSALPAGRIDSNNPQSHIGFGKSTLFASATVGSSDTNYCAELLNSISPYVGIRQSTQSVECISVRCVRDEEEPPFTCGTSKVKDVDNNEYNTVQIGNQCWMKENLRTSTNPASKGNIYTPTITGYDVNTYGLLYDWKAVMQGASSSNANPSGVQGICPTGWHVPSDAEWTQLTDYVSSKSAYQCNGSTSNIAKALASTTGWNSYSGTCCVGNNQSDNNATGFSAVPAGDYHGSYIDFGDAAYFWSATESESDFAHYRYLNYESTKVSSYINGKSTGYSVRCLRDAEASAAMSVTTDSATTVTKDGATLYGNVTSLGTYNQVNAGFKYGTSEDALTSIVAKEDAMTATGLFSCGITGLTANTQYYYKAFAANGTDTVYGEVKNFKTLSINPCPNAATVTDVDGNEYNTVQIGSQCWMKENLRTTKYADGTPISLGNSKSTSTAYRYYPNNDSNTVSTYGYLYNWRAAMRSSSSSENNPSGVQGICPTGWHLPSDAEWTQLTDYVSSQSQYRCNGNASFISKSLAATSGWRRDDFACAIGNYQFLNNATDFSGVPSGDYSGDYALFANSAYFWSTTLNFNDSNSAYIRLLYYNSESVFRNYNPIDFGFGVRCLRN